MQTINTFRDLIDHWPNLGAFAEAIGVPYVNAQQMRYRNGINHQHWAAVVTAAEAIELKITLADLVEISKRSADERRREKEESAA